MEVGFFDEPVDCSLKVGNHRNTPRLMRRLVSLAKKPSTALSQEHEVGVKWKVKRSWRESHWRTLGCLWVGVVVEDHMHDLAGGKLDLDSVEEANKLLVPMALHVCGRSPCRSSTLSAANSVVVPWRL